MAMTTEEIQKAKDKIKALNQKLRAEENRVSSEARKADTHIKATLGGEILRTLFDETSDKYEVALLKRILVRADQAVSREGQARAMFNAHKQALGL